MGPIGYGFVLIGLLCATFGAVLGLGGARSPERRVWLWRAVVGFALSMLAANLTMVIALVTHDFSVRYVAQVGSLSTPLPFTIVSLWSALEGSILFWGVVLGGFVFAFAEIHRHDQARFIPYALGVMLAVAVFFAFLIAGPANPFHTISPVPPDGPGPNPMLQNDVLMIVHPPLLYLGYIGMTVPFGVASAALICGEIDEAWMGPLRRWTMVAWIFLSAGILVGAWWAYAVLGWGGYWAWDPVENASLLPWLTSTAFIHATVVQERRKMLKAWTLSLALVTFLLTILGTFMTRSGVFNSVHAFTQSDIGPTFLAFIAVLLVFSIVLLATRTHLLVSEGRLQSLLSRDAAFFVNNLVFVSLTFTVLLGTLYPLIAEAVRGVRVSVGEPYFNRMAGPLGVAILFLMGAGPMLPWGKAEWRVIGREAALPVAGALATLVACLAAGLRGGYPLTTFALAAFVTVITVRELLLPARARMREKSESFAAAFAEVTRRARRRVGGYIVHLGIVFIFVAVAASTSYSTHAQATIHPGESFVLGDREVRLAGMQQGQEPHRRFVAANLELIDAGGGITTLQPRVNYYERSTDPIGSPAVVSTVAGDYYLSLLAHNPETKSVTLNAWIFPLVYWIWGAIPILVLGTLIAVWPARRRVSAHGQRSPI